ncbi:hypothetical protein B0H17DRAFT_1059112 [Mycena rosella]|uniref:Glycosyltransferase family 18 catalytic domain-containing protein n=1 Tax=Mycena rosella TaxID=1033263 RepID=A0AAD7DKR8_MYCRO|nr:hypothetical protein B0H17DRAFT_1059112 [Mycena rosella]
MRATLRIALIALGVFLMVLFLPAVVHGPFSRDAHTRVLHEHAADVYDRPLNAAPPLAAIDRQANVDILAPTLYPEQQYEWITANQKATHALFRCMERGDCAQNQTKVVIIPCSNFVLFLQKGYVGGEAIWAHSTLQALHNMGYTVLLTFNMHSATQLYHIFANLVKMVIVNPEQADGCLREASCVRSEKNPAGIPAWKLFSFCWWPGPANPLGANWTLSPEDYQYGPNTYLGYSIESQCYKYPFVPHAERKKSQVYILAKFLKFFLPGKTAWPPEFYDAAANATGRCFIENVGPPLKQDAFYDLLSHSAALVGVENPRLSPSPYDALCFGVPFINPISDWDKKNPTDRTKWNTQHDMLKHLSPPHVYHVFKGDRDGFVNAIRDALANPIESYVPDRMRMTAVQDRLGKILERDWRVEAAELLKAREAGTVKGPHTGMLFLLQRKLARKPGIHILHLD